MSGFELRNGQWWCDQAAIDALANEYGTPLYVYSRARLEENYRRVQYAFKTLNAHIHFSVKSNSNGAILRVLRELGSGFDVVSAGEAYRALRAGADPASIVFAGVGKTESELIFALETTRLDQRESVRSWICLTGWPMTPRQAAGGAAHQSAD
jgi:diaminopimelate decarboxylase